MSLSAYFGHLVQRLAHHNNCANCRRGNHAADAVFRQTLIFVIALRYQVDEAKKYCLFPFIYL